MSDHPPAPASDLSREDVEQRMREDGFPEMEILWRRYTRLRVRTEPEEDTLVVARRRHMGALAAHPATMLVVSALVAVLAFRHFYGFIPVLAPAAGPATLRVMSVLFSFNVVFLFWYVLLVVQRQQVQVFPTMLFREMPFHQADRIMIWPPIAYGKPTAFQAHVDSIRQRVALCVPCVNVQPVEQFGIVRSEEMV